MKKQLVFLLALGLLMMPLVTADARLNGEKLLFSSIPGDLIKGTINLTFSNVNLDSVFRTNLGQSISLRQLLEFNRYTSPGQFNCSTPSCQSGYVRGESVSALDLSGSDVLVGLWVEGTNIQISDVDINVQGTSGPSCYPTLQADILNLNQHVIGPARYTQDSCSGQRYGCFESDRPTQLVTIESAPYCSLISLPVTPAVRLGANVILSSSISAPLVFSLVQTDGTLLRECTVQNAMNGTVSCIVNQSIVSSGNYKVCVRSPSLAYKLRAETHTPCGTFGSNPSPVADYELFAQDLMFDQAFLTIDDQTFSSGDSSLVDYISYYIESHYERDCTSGCIIPLKLSGANQRVSFPSARITYDSSIGSNRESSTVYRLEASPVTINSRSLILNLGLANFTLPSNSATRYFELTLGNTTLLSKPLNLSNSFEFSISPSTVIFGQPTQFSITGTNVTGASWNFGEGPQTIEGTTAIHQFTQEGSALITVTARKADGTTSTRRFTIVIGDIQAGIGITLDTYDRAYRSFTQSLNALPLWQQEIVRGQIALDSINVSLGQVRELYENATNQTDFSAIASELFSFSVPLSISADESGSVPLLIGIDAIDTYPLEELSGEEIQSPGKLKSALVYWMTTHYNPSLAFNTYYVEYGSTRDPLMTTFVLNPVQLESGEEPSTLFIGYSYDQLIFAQDEGAQAIAASTYLPVDSNDPISFAVLGQVRPEELGAYIAPSLQTLGTFSEIAPVEETSLSWVKAFVWFFVILALGAGGYYFLRRWYGHNYEKKLFKNKRDLDNLLLFISNAQKKGLKREEIERKLMGAGWSHEQVLYAFHPIRAPTDLKANTKPNFKGLVKK